jgi:hypothetical protein
LWQKKDGGSDIVAVMLAMAMPSPTRGLPDQRQNQSPEQVALSQQKKKVILA